MDSGGIDFVEADFGSEAAAGGLGKVNRSPQDWQRWSQQKFRTPLKPFIFMAVVFVMLISLPWILDCIQDKMLAENSSQENSAALEESAAQQQAAQQEAARQDATQQRTTGEDAAPQAAEDSSPGNRIIGHNADLAPTAMQQQRQRHPQAMQYTGGVMQYQQNPQAMQYTPGTMPTMQYQQNPQAMQYQQYPLSAQYQQSAQAQYQAQAQAMYHAPPARQRVFASR